MDSCTVKAASNETLKDDIDCLWAAVAELRQERCAAEGVPFAAPATLDHIWGGDLFDLQQHTPHHDLPAPQRKEPPAGFDLPQHTPHRDLPAPQREPPAIPHNPAPVNVNDGFKSDRLHFTASQEKETSLRPRNKLPDPARKLGYCFLFNKKGRGCTAGMQCQFKHACSRCDGAHPCDMKHNPASKKGYCYAYNKRGLFCPNSHNCKLRHACTFCDLAHPYCYHEVTTMNIEQPPTEEKPQPHKWNRRNHNSHPPKLSD